MSSTLRRFLRQSVVTRGRSLRQTFGTLKHDQSLRLRRIFRSPSLSTPDLRSTEFTWQEVFQRRVYAHPHLQVGTGPIDVVVDVGANIGLFAAWAAMEYAPRSIYCYEASPVTFRHLRKNLRKLSRIHGSTTFYAIHAAVSNTDGDVREIFHRSGKIGGSTLLDAGRSRGGVPHPVRATTLSRQMRERGIGAVDLLKIDVEGHYWQALQGISDYSGIRRIVLECDWVVEGAKSAPKVARFLRQSGYTVVLDDPEKENNVIVYARAGR